jgi:hypothetical protein
MWNPEIFDGKSRRKSPPGGSSASVSSWERVLSVLRSARVVVRDSGCIFWKAEISIMNLASDYDQLDIVIY